MRRKYYKCPPLIIDKSPYLKRLENRKIAKMTQNEEDKANYLLDKVLGRETKFNRDYSVFFGCNIPPHHLSPNHKFSVYNPGLKLNLKSKTEELFPNKYTTKSINYDSFAMIYKTNPKAINNIHSSNLKSASLTSAGAAIIKSSNKKKKETPILLLTQNRYNSNSNANNEKE